MSASAFLARRFAFRVIACVLAFSVAPCLLGQAQKKAAGQSPIKIRAITAFVNLDRTQYQIQITDAVKMLKRARIILESRGFPVETIRIATQPFPQYIQGLSNEQALAFFRNYDARAAQEGFAASIGPAMPNAGDSPAQADLLAENRARRNSLEPRRARRDGARARGRASLLQI